MIRTISLTRLTTRLLFLVPFAALLYIPSPGLAAASAPDLGSASGFAALAGTAVTCTNLGGTALVTGDVGVWPGNTFTNTTSCTIDGTVHLGDVVAKQAYKDFINAYDDLLNNPPDCDFTNFVADHTSATLAPGVYCFEAAVTQTGTTWTLDAQGDANAVWIFLVDGALTGTNFNVDMIGGDPCNVYWRTGENAGATLTTTNFVGTILSGAAITVTATNGTFQGSALATAAVTLTLTNSTVIACEATRGNVHGKCNQGVGNGPEDCDPGNSNNHNPSNDEPRDPFPSGTGGTPGNPGRKPANR